jgi:hypothetical protein
MPRGAASFRLPKLPGPPRLRATTGRRLAGAPAPPPAARLTAAALAPYPPAPAWFRRLHPLAPLEEWVCYWALTAKLHYREGVQFSYQNAIDLPGRSKPFFRADFVIFREYCDPGGFFPRGMVLDPYTTATHPHPADDLFRFLGLARQGWRLIWLYAPALLREPERLVRDAVLEGRDRSPLATMPGVTGNPIRG